MLPQFLSMVDPEIEKTAGAALRPDSFVFKVFLAEIL